VVLVTLILSVLVIGYLLLAVALSRTIHSAVGLWAADTPEAEQEVMVEAMVLFLAWGVPAAFLVHVGTRLARDRVLLTASAEANS
jgi:hypothetical protein